MIGRPRRWALAVLLAVTAAACGDDGPDQGGVGGDATAGPDDTGDDGPLPPVDAMDLEPIYGDALAAMGLRLTPRGGLIDRSDGYYQSPSGDHLALYVEPIDGRSVEQYVDGILDVSKVFAPDVFERWRELASFDVCQEPVPEVDNRDEPLPVTQIELSREQSDAIEWDTVTIAELVRGSRERPAKLRLALSTTVTASDAFQQATAG